MNQLLIIAASPRSGSYFLCDCMRATGLLGNPAEFAVYNDKENWQEAQKYSAYADYLQDLESAHSSRNGICAIKVMPWQFEEFIVTYCGGRFDSSWQQALLKKFSKVFVLRLLRLDRLSQSLSWARAKKTGFWNTTDQSNATRESQQILNSELLNAWTFIEEQTRSWERLLLRTGLPARVLYYEDFIRDPGKHIQGVASWMGISGDLHGLFVSAKQPMRQKILYPDTGEHLGRFERLLRHP